MAGMIPGVGVPSRKKILNLMQNDVHIRHSKRFFELSIFESSMGAETSMDLDETALKARQRLEMKLYKPSSRSKKIGGKDPRSQKKKKIQEILSWVHHYLGGYGLVNQE